MEHDTSCLGRNRISRRHNYERNTVPVQKSRQLNPLRVTRTSTSAEIADFFYFNQFGNFIQPFQRLGETSHNIPIVSCTKLFNYNFWPSTNISVSKLLLLILCFLLQKTHLIIFLWLDLIKPYPKFNAKSVSLKIKWSGEQDLNLRRLGICGLCRLE